MLFSKRKKREGKKPNPDELTFRERYRAFGERLGEFDSCRRGTLGQYGGMGMGAPPPPVDPGWERMEREAQEMDRRGALEP